MTVAGALDKYLLSWWLGRNSNLTDPVTVGNSLTPVSGIPMSLQCVFVNASMAQAALDH